MPTYTISGKKIRTETKLTDAQIDEVAAHMGGTAGPADAPAIPPVAPAEDEVPQYSALQDIGAGTRNVIQGLASFPGMLYDAAAIPFNLAGANIPPAASQVSQGLTAAGLPESPNSLYTALQAGGASALTPMGAASFAKPITAIGQGLKTALASQPVAQAISGATAAGSSELARKAGMGPIGQTAAGLAGGVAAFPAAGLANFATKQIAVPAARRAYGVVEPFLQKGGQAVEARMIREAFAGDEVKMQKAVDMLDNGSTIQDVAIALNNPTLAGLAEAAKRVPHSDIAGAYAEKAAGKNAAAISQLSGAETFANKAAADARATQVSETAIAFPQGDMEALGIQARSAAESVRSAARVKTKAAYDKVDNLGETLPAMEAPGIFNEAKNIIGEDGFGKNAPELVSVLNGIAKRNTANSVAAQEAANAQRLPWEKAPIKESTPPLTFNELTSIIRAVNADIRQVASNPELRPKLRNLIKLRGSVEKFIANAPETIIPKTAKEALENANQIYKTEFARKFKVGKTQSNMLLDRNGAPVIADEKVIANFFKPNSPSAARRFVDMLGGNPAAYDAMEKGILETFRSKVVKNGVIDENAYKGFIENYRAPLKVLEDAGVDVSAITNKQASLGALGKTADSAESLAAEAKALQSKYNADPNKVVGTIVKDLPEAEAIVAKIRRDIANGKVFDDLAAKDTVGADLLKVDPIGILPPGFDLTHRILNSTLSRLFGTASEKQVRDIAIGLMNETTTKALIERSIQASPSGYAKTGERIKKFLSPTLPPRMNNLSPIIRPTAVKNRLGTVTGTMSDSQTRDQLGQ